MPNTHAGSATVVNGAHTHAGPSKPPKPPKPIPKPRQTTPPTHSQSAKLVQYAQSDFGQLETYASNDGFDLRGHIQTVEVLRGDPLLQGEAWNDIDVMVHYTGHPNGTFDADGVIFGRVLLHLEYDHKEEAGGWTGEGPAWVTGVRNGDPFGDLIYHATVQLRGWGRLEGWTLDLSFQIDPITAEKTYTGEAIEA